MPRKSPFDVKLTDDERVSLETMARRYTSPYRDVIRAKIILYAAHGLPNDVIAARLDTPRQIVSKWRKRFCESGLPGLESSPFLVEIRRPMVGSSGDLLFGHTRCASKILHQGLP
jgi:hypothetical protein